MNWQTSAKDIIHLFIELNGYRLGFYQITDLLSELQMSHEVASNATPKHGHSKTLESTQRKLKGALGDIGTKREEGVFEERRSSAPRTESKRRAVRFTETENNFRPFLGNKNRSISVDETLVREETFASKSPIVRSIGPFLRKPECFDDEPPQPKH